MAAKIVVRGTIGEVSEALRVYDLVEAGELTVNPEGYERPSVMVVVHKLKPLDRTFMTDIFRNWGREENTSLLDW